LQPWVPSSGTAQYNWALFYQDPLYTAACAPVHVLIVATSAFFVARFIRELGFSNRIALWGLFLYGIASPAMVYARGDWAQPLTGLCWIGAIFFAMRFRRTVHPMHLRLCGSLLAYAVLTRPIEGSLLLPAVMAVIAPSLRFRRWTRSSWCAMSVITASYVLGMVITLLVNWGRYGSPLMTGYEGEGWTTPIWTGLAGALVSPGRGILLEFPAIILVPLGLRQLWQTSHRKIAVILTMLVGVQLLNVATWHDWWGGWDWGLRLFVPALPLIAVLVAIGIRGLGPVIRRWLPGALLVAGVIWAVPCVVANLLNGYGGDYNSTNTNFQWRAYPPIGAWQYFHHWRGIVPIDNSSADILWLHMARATGNASLAWPALLLIAAITSSFRTLKLVQSGEPSTTSRQPAQIKATQHDH
jgi:hypothetical protein